MDSVPVRVKGAQAEKTNASKDEGQITSTRGGRQKRDKRPFDLKKWLTIGGIALIVLALIGGMWWWFGSRRTDAIDSSKYQAVFFTSGQVYFGKLEKVNDGYMKLTHVFYIQAQNSSSSTSSQNPQDAAKSQASDLQLVKLGNEIHGPEDEMIISKDQILFYENLKGNGKVADTITKYYAKQSQ